MPARPDIAILKVCFKNPVRKSGDAALCHVLFGSALFANYTFGSLQTKMG